MYLDETNLTRKCIINLRKPKKENDADGGVSVDVEVITRKE